MISTSTQRASARPAGFTLIEILVVVSIIALLVALTLGVSKEVIRRAYEHNTAITLKSVRGLIVEYHLTTGNFPSASDSSGLISQLDTLNDVDVEAIIGKSYQGGKIVDAWGQEIVYYNGSGSAASNIANLYDTKNRVPILASAGPDGTFGSADDVLDPKP